MTPTATAPATTGVLATFEYNGYDDSDFYAIVWDGDRVAIVETHSTRHAGYHNPGPKATAEQDQAARTWIIGPLLERMHRAAEADARAVATNAKVRSTTTRGKNKGVTGTAERITEVTFHHRRRRRVLVRLDTGAQRWMDADRLERTDPEPVHIDQIRDDAARAAHNRPWLDLIQLAGLRPGGSCSPR
jgi:hypothetical protein